MKKYNKYKITFSVLLISIFANMNIVNAQTQEQEKILKNISGIKIKEFGNVSNSKSSQIDKEEKIRQEKEKNDNNLNNSSSTSGEPTPVTGVPVPGSPNVKAPQTITPQNTAIPIPQNYLDMQNNQQQNRGNGQIPIEPIKIQSMTLQNWNTSTIKNFEEKGQENARQKYNEFRRGIQY